MKKFLLSSLISVSVLLGSSLYGMEDQINISFGEILSQKPDPLQELSQIFSEWANYTEDQRSEASKKLWDNYLDEYAYDRLETPIKKKIIEKVFQGIDAATREPSQWELEMARSLLPVLGLPSNCRIRIQDAESIINSLNLSEDRKRAYLAVINGGDIESLIPALESNMRFMDPNQFAKEGSFKRSVLKEIIESSKKSRIFKEQMVAFIARAEAIPPIFEKCFDDPSGGYPSFSYGTKLIYHDPFSSVFVARNVTSLSLEPISMLSFFAENKDMGLGSFKEVISSIYHEAGHANFYYWLPLVMKPFDNTMEVASNFLIHQIFHKI